MFRWGLFSGVVTILGFVIGLRWGAIGVAASLFVTTVARIPLLYAYCVQGTSVRSRDLYAIMAEPMLGAGLAWFAVRAMDPYLPMGALLLVSLPVAYGLAIAVHAMTANGRDLLRTLSRLAGSTITGTISGVRAGPSA
jgi:PST family polysaccharide transporter